jgi:predicted Rossmann-fold nucleotide-binding protein
MILGFTGTRGELPIEQQAVLVEQLLRLRPTTVLHGGAPGADELAHAEVTAMGLVSVEVYPGSGDRYRYWHQRWIKEQNFVLKHPMAPLARDKVIARRCDHLLACPGTMEEIVRSGTWATVRYARAAGKPITIVLPDGSVRRE